MGEIVLAYAPADAAMGAAVEEILEAAGFDVSTKPPPSSRAWLAKRAAAAQAVVVLWSRHAPSSPGVLRQAAQARAAGKLIAAHLDKVPAPLAARGNTAVDLSAPDGLEALLARLTVPAKAASTPTPTAGTARASGTVAPAAAPAAVTAPEPARRGGSSAVWVMVAISLLAALAAAFLFL